MPLGNILHCFISHPVCCIAQTKRQETVPLSNYFPPVLYCECDKSPGSGISCCCCFFYFTFLSNLFLAGHSIIEFFIRRGNTSNIPFHDSFPYQCLEGFIFTRSVNPKSRHVPDTEHYAAWNQCVFKQRRHPHPDPRTFQLIPSDFACSDLLAFHERSFLACMLVNSICRVKFKCFGDVKGLLELWQL